MNGCQRCSSVSIARAIDVDRWITVLLLLIRDTFSDLRFNH
jgi:hypothetical protein